METTELVLKTLAEAGKPLKGAEIAEIAGIDKKTLIMRLKN